MNWKQQLRVFELNKQWDQAIEFMQIAVEANPDYLYLNHKISNQSIAAIEYAQQALQMGSEVRNKLLWYSDFYEYLSEEIIKWAKGAVARNSKAQQWQA